MYARGRRGNDRIGKAGANSGEMNFEKTKSKRARCEYLQGTTLLELVHFISFPSPPLLRTSRGSGVILSFHSRELQGEKGRGGSSRY